MTYRRTLKHRPWITGAAHDKYTTESRVHYDLYCYRDGARTYYFEIHATASGKTPLAYSRFAVCPLTDALVPMEGAAPLENAKAVQWSRRTHGLFSRHHAALLALCDIPPAFTTRSILCHYVKPYDADPWPRGFTNFYMAPVYGEGKRPGRPRAKPEIFDGLTGASVFGTSALTSDTGDTPA